MTLPRLIFVTGKGGTGKSTVAAALAVALSHRRPAILADLDRRRSALRLLANFNGAQAAVPIGKNLEGVALSSQAELEAFIERIVPLKAISRRMLQSRTFGYVTAALPGLEAFLMLERLRIMAGDSALKDHFLVVDAPASGSAIELLSVAQGVKGIAPVGTLHRLASAVQSFLGDPDRFGVLLTATPEEMALREVMETAAALRDSLHVRCVAVVLNAAAGPLFDAADLAALTPLKLHAQLALKRNAMT